MHHVSLQSLRIHSSFISLCSLPSVSTLLVILALVHLSSVILSKVFHSIVISSLFSVTFLVRTLLWSFLLWYFIVHFSLFTIRVCCSFSLCTLVCRAWFSLSKSFYHQSWVHQVISSYFSSHRCTRVLELRCSDAGALARQSDGRSFLQQRGNQSGGRCLE